MHAYPTDRLVGGVAEWTQSQGAAKVKMQNSVTESTFVLPPVASAPSTTNTTSSSSSSSTAVAAGDHHGNIAHGPPEGSPPSFGSHRGRGGFPSKKRKIVRRTTNSTGTTTTISTATGPITTTTAASTQVAIAVAAAAAGAVEEAMVAPDEQQQQQQHQQQQHQHDEMNDQEDPAAGNLHRLASVLLNQHLQSPLTSTTPVNCPSPPSSPPSSSPSSSASSSSSSRRVPSTPWTTPAGKAKASSNGGKGNDAMSNGSEMESVEEEEEEEEEEDDQEGGIGSRGLELVARLLRLGRGTSSSSAFSSSSAAAAAAEPLAPLPTIVAAPPAPPHTLPFITLPPLQQHEDSLLCISSSPSSSRSPISSTSRSSPSPLMPVEGLTMTLGLPLSLLGSPRAQQQQQQQQVEGTTTPIPPGVKEGGEEEEEGQEVVEDAEEEEEGEEEDEDEDEAPMTKMPLPFAASVAGNLLPHQHPQPRQHHRNGGQITTINSAHSNTSSSHPSHDPSLEPNPMISNSHHYGRKHKSKPPVPPVPRAPMEILWGGPGPDKITSGTAGGLGLNFLTMASLAAIPPPPLASLPPSLPPLRPSKRRPSAGPPPLLLDLRTMSEMVSALRYEDPKLPSPRMSLLVAAFRASPSLRLPMLQATTQACHDRMIELGAVTRELISMEKDLRGAMHRDHGVGLAELLSSLVMCIREEMGLRSPELLTDEDEQEEEEGGREGGVERKRSEGSVDDVDDTEVSAATAQGQQGQHQPQQQQRQEQEEPERVAPPPVSSSSSSSSSGKGMEYQETKDQDQQTTQTEEGMSVVMCESSSTSSSSSSSTSALSSPTFMECNDRVQEEDEQQQQQQQQEEEDPPLPDQPQEPQPPPPPSLLPSLPHTLASRWGQSMLLLREALVALGIFLRAHSRKRGSSSSALDRAEMEHVRDAVAEMIAAYSPTALRITELVLRAWPTGQSTREMGFLQLLSVVLTVSPLLPRLEERTRVHHRAFARLARCLQSPHAGVAEEALLACSNPRVIALYVGVGAPGGGGEGLDYVNGMVQMALGRSIEAHWNPEVRLEARRLRELLNVIRSSGVRAIATAAAAAATAAQDAGGSQEEEQAEEEEGGGEGVTEGVGEGGGTRCCVWGWRGGW